MLRTLRTGSGDDRIDFNQVGGDPPQVALNQAVIDDLADGNAAIVFPDQSVSLQDVAELRTINLGEGNDFFDNASPLRLETDLVIRGGGGNEIIFAGGGNDKIFGGSGNDNLSAESGNDRLFGGRGNDSLFGDQGRDQLNGGRDNDRLNGGEGNDKLTGGGGADKFLFRGDFGKDVITDFRKGQGDSIELIGFNPDDVSINAKRGNIIIKVDDGEGNGGQITVKGSAVDLGDLFGFV